MNGVGSVALQVDLEWQAREAADEQGWVRKAAQGGTVSRGAGSQSGSRRHGGQGRTQQRRGRFQKRYRK